MRVLLLLSRIEKSGVALHTFDLIKGLKASGHSVSLISGGNTDPENPYLANLYKEAQACLDSSRVFITPKGILPLKIIQGVLATVQILWWLLRTPHDVLHVQSPYLTFLPWLLGKRFVSTVHNVQLRPKINYKNATELIAISEESRNFAIETLGAKPASVQVVCHGIPSRFAEISPESQLSGLRERYGLRDDRLLIGFVGRITRDKGLDILLGAAAGLRPQLRDHIQIVFLGDYYSEADRKWLEDLLPEARENLDIIQVPFQDPKPFYELFDVFVLPSLSEAFGLVCVEAMMSGCCTIRTDTNGALDQITDGEDGFIYPRTDQGALESILSQVLGNASLRDDVSSKGKVRALNNFTLEAMTEKTLKVYQKLV